MAILGKFFAGLIFSLLFIGFNVFTVLNFQLLNGHYLFNAFERHNLYEELPQLLAQSIPNDPKLSEEEKEGYIQILSSLPPDTVEKIIEDNISSALGFIHGSDNNLTLSLPANDIGIATENITWQPNSEVREIIEVFSGIGTIFLIIWMGLLVLLVLIFYIYKKLPQSRVDKLLIINGSVIFLAGILLEIFFFFVVRTFPQNFEPAQALIRSLFSSIFPEIAMLWMLFGLITVFISLLLKRKLFT
jgi:hypothetical protein